MHQFISRKVEEVTVFSHFLHMHENGQRSQTRQYRNDTDGNEVLIHTAEVEYYSFEQAGGHSLYPDGTVTIQVGGRERAVHFAFDILRVADECMQLNHTPYTSGKKTCLGVLQL